MTYITANFNDPLEQFEIQQFFFPCNFSVFMDNITLTFLLGIIFFLFLTKISSKRQYYSFILLSIYNLIKNIVNENLAIKKQQYFPVVFYLFIIIFINNALGLIPYAFTTTSSFVVTLFLAATHFIGFNIILAITWKWRAFGLFLPQGAPLIIAPFLCIIEGISYVARVFSLSIRLFANMMAGHALLKILSGFSWTMLTAGTGISLLALFPWLIVTAILFLEVLIAFLQAYVFVILITIYINDVLNLH